MQKGSKATDKVEAEQTPKASAESEAPQANDRFCCYIGPSLIGVIQHGTLYPKGRSEVLKRPEVALAIEKHPEIAALIVEGDTINESKAQIKAKHGLLYQAYKALAKK